MQHEMTLTANDRQVGGDHYKKRNVLQHWDIVAMLNLDYFQGNISKYVFRWRDKDGVKDLKKAQHYVQKYIEVEEARANGTLTRQILERAIRELEGIESEDEEADAYRAASNGDDPVGDKLSEYPRSLEPGHVADVYHAGTKQLYRATIIEPIVEAPDDDARFAKLPPAP